jgi:hypothetical protein
MMTEKKEKKEKEFYFGRSQLKVFPILNSKTEREITSILDDRR